MRLCTIYKIIVGTDKIYIGSTIQSPPQKRWWDHQSNHLNPNCSMYILPLYVEMRSVGIDACHFEIIRQFQGTQQEGVKEETLEMLKYKQEELLNERPSFTSYADRKKKARENAKRKREEAKAKDAEGFLKKESDKRQVQREKKKAENLELYMRRQREYNQGLRIPEIKIIDPLETKVTQAEYFRLKKTANLICKDILN